ncbi:hypothetical protein IQ230_07645 [Gloeocapsopsis crepidinum LEGE 06123]|uniref:VOC domain-containing protein n=1 Tax=Gloeocapsopsis crepidinum LEGE 06123 TaxID=588587 RepID=A0ABR9UQA0_9CHRO|nr:hypothetical protein [Gloeocapsopsis crepidinum]MBE9190235.1 hypothetical protein [Gloeocapsopsis crepidinum LEGE 06123]
MLHHISIAVDNPLHVAEILAQVCHGQSLPFPPHPGSYIVIADDEYGTAIELYPAGTELIPGVEEAAFSHNNFSSPFTAVHAAISVPTSREEIEDIGAREGWLVRQCDRDPFHVIEFWVENKLMLEFLPPDLALEYLNFMQPQNWRAFVNSAVPAVTGS